MVFILVGYLICLLLSAVLSVTYVILCLVSFLMVQYLHLSYLIIIVIYLIHLYYLKYINMQTLKLCKTEGPLLLKSY